MQPRFTSFKLRPCGSIIVPHLSKMSYWLWKILKWSPCQLPIILCPNTSHKDPIHWFTLQAHLPRTRYDAVMMTSSNGNIFRVTGHLCGEFTGHGEFPAQRPVMRGFDDLFDLRANIRLSKQSWGWWFETPWRSLCRQCNDIPWNMHSVWGVIGFVVVMLSVLPWDLFIYIHQGYFTDTGTIVSK